MLVLSSGSGVIFWELDLIWFSMIFFTMIKKPPYLFFSYVRSMYYKYLPCQIFSHDFDEKSDFLNNEFSLRLHAITPFKNGRVQKRELGRGRMWGLPIKSSKQTWLLEYSEEECEAHVLSFVMCFRLRLSWKRFYGDAVLSWLDDVTRRPNNRRPTNWRFE